MDEVGCHASVRLNHSPRKHGTCITIATLRAQQPTMTMLVEVLSVRVRFRWALAGSPGKMNCNASQQNPLKRPPADPNHPCGNQCLQHVDPSVVHNALRQADVSALSRAMPSINLWSCLQTKSAILYLTTRLPTTSIYYNPSR